MMTGLREWLHDALDREEHTSSVESFYYRFEAIRSLMQIVDPEIPEEYLASRFVFGLQAEFQSFIFKFQPTTVIAAYRLALIFEESIYLDYFPETEWSNDEIYRSSNTGYHIVDSDVVITGEGVLGEELSCDMVNVIIDEESDLVEDALATLIYDSSISQAVVETQLNESEIMEVRTAVTTLNCDFEMVNDKPVAARTCELAIDSAAEKGFVDQVEVPIAWDFGVVNKEGLEMIQNCFATDNHDSFFVTRHPPQCTAPAIDEGSSLDARLVELNRHTDQALSVLISARIIVKYPSYTLQNWESAAWLHQFPFPYQRSISVSNGFDLWKIAWNTSLVMLRFHSVFKAKAKAFMVDVSHKEIPAFRKCTKGISRQKTTDGSRMARQTNSPQLSRWPPFLIFSIQSMFLLNIHLVIHLGYAMLLANTSDFVSRLWHIAWDYSAYVSCISSPLKHDVFEAPQNNIKQFLFRGTLESEGSWPVEDSYCQPDYAEFRDVGFLRFKFRDSETEIRISLVMQNTTHDDLSSWHVQELSTSLGQQLSCLFKLFVEIGALVSKDIIFLEYIWVQILVYGKHRHIFLLFYDVDMLGIRVELVVKYPMLRNDQCTTCAVEPGVDCSYTYNFLNVSIKERFRRLADIAWYHNRVRGINDKDFKFCASKLACNCVTVCDALDELIPSNVLPSISTWKVIEFCVDTMYTSAQVFAARSLIQVQEEVCSRTIRSYEHISIFRKQLNVNDNLAVGRHCSHTLGVRRGFEPHSSIEFGCIYRLVAALFCWFLDVALPAETYMAAGVTTSSYFCESQSVGIFLTLSRIAWCACTIKDQNAHFCYARQSTPRSSLEYGLFSDATVFQYSGSFSEGLGSDTHSLLLDITEQDTRHEWDYYEETSFLPGLSRLVFDPGVKSDQFRVYIGLSLSLPVRKQYVLHVNFNLFKLEDTQFMVLGSTLFIRRQAHFNLTRGIQFFVATTRCVGYEGNAVGNTQWKLRLAQLFAYLHYFQIMLVCAPLATKYFTILQSPRCSELCETDHHNSYDSVCISITVGARISSWHAARIWVIPWDTNSVKNYKYTTVLLVHYMELLTEFRWFRRANHEFPSDDNGSVRSEILEGILLASGSRLEDFLWCIAWLECCFKCSSCCILTTDTHHHSRKFLLTQSIQRNLLQILSMWQACYSLTLESSLQYPRISMSLQSFFGSFQRYLLLLVSSGLFASLFVWLIAWAGCQESLFTSITPGSSIDFADLFWAPATMTNIFSHICLEDKAVFKVEESVRPQVVEILTS